VERIDDSRRKRVVEERLVLVTMMMMMMLLRRLGGRMVSFEFLTIHALLLGAVGVIKKGNIITSITAFSPTHIMVEETIQYLDLIRLPSPHS
jgi:hypothetical protein